MARCQQSVLIAKKIDNYLRRLVETSFVVSLIRRRHLTVGEQATVREHLANEIDGINLIRIHAA